MTNRNALGDQVSRVLRLVVWVVAALPASALAQASNQGLRPCGGETEFSVAYSTCESIGVAIGEVIDVEVETLPGPNLRRDRLGRPLLLLKTELAQPQANVRQMPFELAERGRNPVGQEPLRRGERVLVTHVKEAPVRKWSCGRLRACGPAPAEILIAIETFRPTDLP
jgi:hypothetical protein